MICESAALNMPANLEDSAVATRLEKVSFHSSPKKKAMPKNAQTTAQLHSFHMLLSKVMIKILLARLQQYTNQEIPDVQAGFRKGRGSRDRIVSICWIIEKAREFKKKKKNLLLLHRH